MKRFSFIPRRGNRKYAAFLTALFVFIIIVTMPFIFNSDISIKEWGEIFIPLGAALTGIAGIFQAANAVAKFSPSAKVQAEKNET